MSSTPLSNEEYDQRRAFVEELKRLSKTEQIKLFELLRAGKEDYSENSNGVFFDVAKVSKATFEKLQDYMSYCKTVREDLAGREEKTQHVLNSMR